MAFDAACGLSFLHHQTPKAQAWIKQWGFRHEIAGIKMSVKILGYTWNNIYIYRFLIDLGGPEVIIQENLFVFVLLEWEQIPQWDAK